MGKSHRNRKAKDLFDTSDDDSMSSSSTMSMSDLVLPQGTEHVTSRERDLEKYLDALYEKRGSIREKALSGLVAAFESHVLLGFVENKSYTLFQQFIKSIKRGSAIESCLASRAIGLLIITIGCGDNAHEIMEESLPQLSKVLKSGSGSLTISTALDCLAIISFVGGTSVEERETSMKFIWEFLHPKHAFNSANTKPAPEVLAPAVSAWTFLLTTINEWRISSTNWKESISFLSTLLDNNDRTVRIAAGEAIAVIFEIGRIDKFSKELNECLDGLDLEGSKPQGGFANVEALKGKILNQVRDLSMEAGGKGACKKDLSVQRALFKEILAFIETRECPEVSLKVSNTLGMLTSATWASSIQMKFLKRFLGSGFQKHMQDNELLHDVFDFTPQTKEKNNEVLQDVFDFIPKKKVNVTTKNKRLFKSPNSVTSKERTQFINTRRVWAQEKNLGHYTVMDGDD